MFSRGIARCRIPLYRPLRPPNVAHKPRPFTQNAQLLLLAQRAGPRPQLPYLSQSTRLTNTSLLGPNPQLARLISTENRTYIREQVWIAAKYTAIFYTFAALAGIAWFGFEIEREERKQPTPDEWSWWTRWRLRRARAQIGVGSEAGGFVDWAVVGSALRNCLERLEDKGKDGKGLSEVEEGGILVEGLGKAGLDISGKSWPWRAGYFEVLMGCAAAGEHLDGMMLDETRGLVFPREVMIGPSNPDPRPVPVYMNAAPKEENCVRPFDPPETYYMRILTSKGFTTKQRLDAALAYANWLEFKGLNDSAEEMYIWGLDIAKAGLPTATHSEQVIDAKTSVLTVGATQEATPNLLRATTALAIHHARTGNVSTALPILLSILRARRTAPVSPFPRPSGISIQEEAKTDIGAASNFLKKVFRPPQFPPPPPSGDLALVRQSEKPTCEESELMLYIGEILFATSPASSEGLGWTRQAVTVAEANLQSAVTGGPLPVAAGADEAEEKAKCKACLITGVGNWETMLRRLSEQQGYASVREGPRNAGLLEWRGWFGGDGGQKGRTLDELHSGVLGEELKQVERLKERIFREGIDVELAKSSGGGGSAGLWVGG